MDYLSTAVAWLYQGIAVWWAAAIIGGVLILLAERLARGKDPSDSDVQRAAERYRQWYGERALDVIGDHLLAASFAPDSRHRRFLKRVSAELMADVRADDRTYAFDDPI